MTHPNADVPALIREVSATAEKPHSQTVQAKLEDAARKLLDLTLRNKLVKFKESSRIHMEVYAGSLGSLANLLVDEEERKIPLEPVQAKPGDGVLWTTSNEETILRFVVANQEDQDRGPRNLAHEAHVFEEEHGYGALFIALGFLEWTEAPGTAPFLAPLLLYPVVVERGSRGKGFVAISTGDEPHVNPAIQLKLRDQGVNLPDPKEFDAASVATYVKVVENLVKDRGWRIVPKTVLGMFKFHKFVMYRDLKALGLAVEQGGELPGAIDAVLDPDPEDPRLESTPVMTEQEVDQKIKWSEANYVVDADPSQIVAIEEVKSGKHLVIQGPPGTGKSQTIANLIAELLGQNKRVLFVSEKEAALKVVKRRLDAAGIGDFCLALHGVKTSHEQFRKQMAAIMAGGFRLPSGVKVDLKELERDRKSLENYAVALRSPPTETDIKTAWAIGQVIALRERYPADLLVRWSSRKRRPANKEDLLASLELARERIRWYQSWGRSSENPWQWCRHPQPDLVPTLQEIQSELVQGNAQLAAEAQGWHNLSGLPPPTKKSEISELVALIPHFSDSRSVPDIKGAADYGPLDSTAEAAIARLSQLIQLRDQLKAHQVNWPANAPSVELRDRLRAASKGFLHSVRSAFRRAKRDAHAIYEDRGRRPRQRLEADLDLLARFQAARNGSQEVQKQSSRLAGFAPDQWDEVVRSLSQLRTWLGSTSGVIREQHGSDHLARVFARPDEARNHAESIGRIAVEWQKLESIAARLAGVFATDIPPFVVHGEADEVSPQFLSWYSTNSGMLGPWLQHVDWTARVGAAWLDALALHDPADFPGDVYWACAEFSMVSSVVEAAMREFPVLGTFTAISHEDLRKRFRELDSSLEKVARRRLVERLSERAAAAALAAFPGTPMGTLKHELGKKRRRKPIRKLVAETMSALGDLKPCFMMSPLTVATYLAPAAKPFDVLIFDEASQVRPEDALVCLMRANQVVVVGDSKQLPPTSFFDSAEAETDEDIDDDRVTDMESILDECVGKAFPERMLRWHYRSRHHSLIEGSNQEFYNGRLLVFRSPSNEVENMGLRHHYFPTSVYGEGGNAVNRREAQEVARLAYQHWQQTPKSSLGVVAFSLAQYRELYDQVYALANKDAQFLEWIERDVEEPFFVKNLESVQGDERDHIIISVGYGKDATDQIRRRFGPVNKMGGERRLNVLFTRAKERTTVVSNFRSAELAVDDMANRGPHVLKNFLALAESGKWPEVETAPEEFDSPFEEMVKDFLEKNGFRVVPQVGCAGYRIDLAVCHPTLPGTFCIGVECDGAQYHSSHVARERDRQRQEILEKKLQWKLYRVWSTEWFHRPQSAKEKLLAAVKAAASDALTPPAPATIGDGGEPADANAANGQRDLGGRQDSPTPPVTSEIVDIGGLHEAAQLLLPPYLHASVDGRTLHEGLAESRSRNVADVAMEIIRGEAPLHFDVLVERLRMAADQGRAGERARDAVRSALIRHYRGEITIQEGFVRLRSKKATARQRSGDWKPEHIPPEEIDEVILKVVRSAKQVPLEVLFQAARAALGYGRLGKDLRRCLEAGLNRLEKKKAVRHDGELVLPAND